MRKSSALIFLSFILILSFFTIENIRWIHVAKATYIEGLITRDTIWTLVDSPLIVSNNITVQADATLTIEPEVEVRFGGNFSIIVEGTLIANGEQNRIIQFTSNKDNPQAGDWGTIMFNGTQPSTMNHCTIEYGTSGITIENGNLTIQNSQVRLNSENGLTITNGTANIENNIIASNTLNGIQTIGSNLTIIDNTIKLNGNGIALTGNTTSTMDILQNNILNNANGILLEADIDNITIANNTLSANSHGFYVSTNSSTSITRNYVLSNDVGMYYEAGTNHTANFNNIYGNNLAMETSTNGTIDATRNYWGDKTGPHHISLNPRGKGDHIEGDGVNLDFIFWLTAPIDYPNTPPTANLWTDRLLVPTNQNVTFIGTNSDDTDTQGNGRVDEYLYGFGDGTETGWTTLSLANHTYTSPGTYNASLRVKDDFGAESSVTFTTIDVQDLPSLDTSITLSNDIIGCNKQVNVTAHVSDGTTPVENADVTLFFVLKGAKLAPISGLTQPDGDFTAAFITPNVTEVENIRIIARASLPSANRADGSDYKYLKVLPLLLVDVKAEPPIVRSEETTFLTINVRDSSLEPVAEAFLNLTVSEDTGAILSYLSGVANADGMVTFYYTVPQTLNDLTLTVAATANKAGYDLGFGQGSITVTPRILVTEVTADPTIILSEATSNVTVHVTCDSTATNNATVTLTSDLGGSFAPGYANTNPNGYAIFSYTAPRTTTEEGINATLTATATLNGYIAGQSQITIAVRPRVLSVQVSPKSNSTFSEAPLNFTFHVEYERRPVKDATVRIMIDNSTAAEGLTGTDGNATLTVTTPQVNEQTNITLTTITEAAGYMKNQSQLSITINPRAFNIQMTAPEVQSEETATITLTAKYAEDSTPVEGATVTMTPINGTSQTKTTDATGTCVFEFATPKTTEQIALNVNAIVNKSGYSSARSQTTITVIPLKAEEGWSLTTMILIVLIPTVIVMAIVILLKLKIITISFKE